MSRRHPKPPPDPTEAMIAEAFADCPPADRRPWTDREVAVLRAVCGKYSRREIAARWPRMFPDSPRSLAALGSRIDRMTRQ